MSQPPYWSLVRSLCGSFRRTRAVRSQSPGSCPSTVPPAWGSGSLASGCVWGGFAGVPEGGGCLTSLVEIHKKYIYTS